jgi:RNAse (barnase) inhibitor barstar
LTNELELLYQLVEVDLLSTSQNNKQSVYVDYLKERYPCFLKHCKIRFAQENDIWHLTRWKSYGPGKQGSVQLLHPSASHQEDANTLAKLLQQARDQLFIKENQIHSVTYHQRGNHTLLELSLHLPYEDVMEDEIKFAYYNVFLSEGMDAIKQMLHKNVFLLTHQQLKEYVQHLRYVVEFYCQSVIEKLSVEERLQLYSISSACTLSDTLKTVYHHLEDFLIYLEKRFSHCLDVAAQVPYRRSLLATLTYQQKSKTIEDLFTSHGIDSSLIQLVLQPLKEACGAKEKISYQLLSYVDNYLQHLENYLNNPLQVCIKEGVVIDLLCSLNCNSLQFFHFLVNRISKTIEEKESVEEKLQELHRQLKTCKQTFSVTEKYIPDLDPIHVSLAGWIKEEVKYWNYNLQMKDSGAQVEEKVSKRKMLVKMSVAQLTYFARLALEAGLIQPESHQDLFRFLSEKFRTQQTEQISKESIGAKYYNTELQTKASVERVIERMLEHARKANT